MVKLIIRGIVQGVGFRPTVVRIAKRLGLSGYVINKGSHVEIAINGDHSEFLENLINNLPPLAKIDSIEVIDFKLDSKHTGFNILSSEKGEVDSFLHPDVGICSECLKEIFNSKNRRYMYPFTNCVNCGARYSIIEDLPYDRERTAMKEFPLCSECLSEFKDVNNRRYHAQTISCWKCGPKYFLYDGNRKLISSDTLESIEKFSKLIESGGIGLVKGWGGMHLVSRIDCAQKLRKYYRREQKPFAVMARDLKSAKKYAEISKDEEKVLTSPERPIVILRKKKEISDELDGVAPGLPNIGIMLPYSGLHYLIFEFCSQDLLIFTSANPPGEAMAIDNEEAFVLKADSYLLHNRKIVNRIDDSLLRVYNGRKFFIRRSRGFCPKYFQVNYYENILSLGAELNSTFSISKNGRLYLSHFIGNLWKYSVLEYMEETIRKFLRWLNLKELDKIVIDLHPGYSYRDLARRLSEEYSCELVEVQHHWAHCRSLAFDNGLDELVALALDGTGYGLDGKAWGGEVIRSTNSDFSRIGSLEEIPLPGGEKAFESPKRILFSICEKAGIEMEIEDAEILRRILKDSPITTSFGRFLDALSSLFDVCQRRTYDGEPAMKLEKLLLIGSSKGVDENLIETYSTSLNGRKTVLITPVFQELIERLPRAKGERERGELAYSAVRAVLRELVYIALESGADVIGITGGVSYNQVICDIFCEILEKEGRDAAMHNEIPNGDGGISVGQNLIASDRL